MCGVAGVVDAGGEQAVDAVERMVVAMRHRGPDDHGVHGSGGAVLGSTRLAIFDLSAAGHQPMQTADGRYLIAYNGEIYNFRALRRELEAAGRGFCSGSDTEVLLTAWAEWGEACLERVRGMFAFAIWDSRERTLTAARDHTGIKPLVYAVRGRRLVFSSELKALLASGLVEPEIEPLALRHCLTVGYVVPPATALRDVSALRPGELLRWRDGRVELSRFWDLPAEPPPEPPASSAHDAAAAAEYQAAVELVRGRVRESVAEQMVADVPVGLFLSGGLDSSLMLATMAKNASGPIECFTVGFAEDAGLADERQAAAATARRFGARHHEVVVTGREVSDRFREYVVALDQPSIDGLNSFWVSRVARQHVTVALSGLGGDELFGGYGWARSEARAGGPPATMGAVTAAMWRLGRLLPAGRARNLVRRRAEATDLVGRYALRQEVGGCDGAAALLRPELASACPPGGRIADALAPSDDPTLRDPLRRLMRLDLANFMAARLLRDIDAVGMACSLEVRFPLLDHRLVEDAFRLPAAFKVAPGGGAAPTYGAGRLKRVLYDAFAAELPPDFGARRRRGFELPFARWLRGDLSPHVEDVLRGGGSELFRPDALADLWRRWQAGRVHWKVPWMVTVLELWRRDVLTAPLRSER